MSYICPLEPPHVNADGQRMTHASKRECQRMGKRRRALAPDSPTPTPSVVPNEPSGSVGISHTPPEGATQGGEAALHQPSASEGQPEGTASVSKPPEVPMPGPAKTSKKEKRGIFGVGKRKADAPPEGETAPDLKKEKPIWERDLPGDYVVTFWVTIIDAVRGGINMGDKAFHVDKPLDTTQFQLSPSNKEMLKNSGSGFTSRILRGLGFKTVEGAMSFIDGMVVIVIFGKLIMVAGFHMVSEWPKSWKKWAEEKDKKAKAITVNARPAPPSPGEVETERRLAALAAADESA